MKKIFCAILTIVLSTIAISCKTQVDYSIYVSELRTNIYQGEKDEVKIVVYTGFKESPFIADGYVGEIKKYIIVRLVSCPENIDGVSVSINYDKGSVSGMFEYHPIGGKYIAEFCVEELPTEPTLSAKVNVAGQEVVIDLATLKDGNCIDYKSAINSVKKYDEEVFENLFEKNHVNAEIHIRLLSDSDKNYYYVGLVSSDGKTNAYLVDALSGNTIAKK